MDEEGENKLDVIQMLQKIAKNKRTWKLTVGDAFAGALSEMLVDNLSDYNEKQIEWWDNKGDKEVVAESRRLFMLGLEADEKSRNKRPSKKIKKN